MKKLLIILGILYYQATAHLKIHLDPKNRDFTLFWEDQANTKTEKTKRVYLNSLRHFKVFTKSETFPMRNLNEKVLKSFKKHLLDTCKKEGTASTILGNTMTIEKVAERWGLINMPIVVQRIALVRSPKVYFTNSEIKKLAKTYCKNLDVKRAFLFACISGLRISDLRLVEYGNLIRKKGNYTLSLNMYKTKQPIYNQLPKTVKSILYPKQDKNNKIFSDLPKSDETVARHLQEWVKEAGIDKHITMHKGRYSYGVNIMEKTGSIYTVMIALGHKSILTTIWSYGHIKSHKMNQATRLDGVNLNLGKIKNTKKRKSKGKKRKNRRRKK